MTSQVDELGLQNPKASPAETLRAYRFFTKDRLWNRYPVYFVAIELICVLLFILIPESPSGFEDVHAAIQSADHVVRSFAVFAGFLFALITLHFLFKRSCYLTRIRLSVWEQELKIYEAKPRAILATTIAAWVALVAWIPAIIFHVFSLQRIIG